MWPFVYPCGSKGAGKKFASVLGACEFWARRVSAGAQEAVWFVVTRRVEDEAFRRRKAADADLEGDADALR